ncbi:MAG: 16S rRNA (cytosine(1402)-N(4))-methyltransferase RsmH [Candidatus Sumerlaeia bacterium]|nr:16S rRNA (cytosine(1402)-N(4))-methyltransferase RsmH [Candidatus Sumerlaeia bacterium]
MEHRHEPVMARQVLEVLNPSRSSVVLDGTLGAAGHARLLAERLGPEGFLLGLDRDPAMAERGRARLAEACAARTDAPRFAVEALSYERAGDALAKHGFEGADAIALDLGLNSIQLADASRGFSFQHDGPLDMRFNPAEPGTPSVAELVADATESELATWMREFADERFAGRIASAIVRERAKAPIATTARLAEVVRAAVPAAARRGPVDAATRPMQALRIAANREYEVLEAGLRACLAALRPGGVLAVISFHSGEDRRVKEAFDAVGSPRPDPGNPYSATTRSGLEYEVKSRGAMKPSDEEVARNPRARSARLRAVRRLRPGEVPA